MRSLASKTDRSLSTSPPPEPLSEEFMVPSDDKYRMVEDEFLAMAGSFTRHLHAAEYQRLKDMASSHNADMIRTISRPVTGRMTDLVKKRQEALKLAERQGKVLRKRKGRDEEETDDEEGGEVPWAGTSLQGLMESPRKIGVKLGAGSNGTSRTAGGASRSVPNDKLHARYAPSETATESEDADDLDSQPVFSARLSSLKRSGSAALSSAQKRAAKEAAMRRSESLAPSHIRVNESRPSSVVKTEKLASPAPGNDRFKTTSVRPAGASAARIIPQVIEDSDEEEDSFAARVRKRREEQERRRQRQKAKSEEATKDQSILDSNPII